MFDIEWLDKRRRAYREVFQGPDAELVLTDLAKFCSAHSSTFVPDDPGGRTSAFREGRREVFLRIQEMIRIDDEKMRQYVENQGDTNE